MDKPSEDPLAKEETTMQVDSFLCDKDFFPEERTRCFQLLEKLSLAHSSLRQEELVLVVVGPLPVDELVVEVAPFPDSHCLRLRSDENSPPPLPSPWERQCALPRTSLFPLSGRYT